MYIRMLQVNITEEAGGILGGLTPSILNSVRQSYWKEIKAV